MVRYYQGPIIFLISSAVIFTRDISRKHPQQATMILNQAWFAHSAACICRLVLLVTVQSSLSQLSVGMTTEWNCATLLHFPFIQHGPQLNTARYTAVQASDWQSNSCLYSWKDPTPPSHPSFDVLFNAERELVLELVFDSKMFASP